MDVIRRMREPVGPVHCVSISSSRGCPLDGDCAFLPLWTEICDTVSNVFSSTTFAGRGCRVGHARIEDPGPAGFFQQRLGQETAVKKPTIVSRYLFREMIPPFGVTLVFFTFIFLMSHLLELTRLIVNYRIGMAVMLRMLFFSMPFFLAFIIPMAVMMAVLMAFLRMSSDNEIIALKSSGVSIYRLLPPVLLFCCAGFLMSGFMSTAALPWGKLAFRQTLVEVASRHFDVAVKERTFIDQFDGLMIYVSRVDPKDRTLQDVFIEDRRKKEVVSTVVAPRGRIFRSADGMAARLRLYGGTIHHTDPMAETVHVLRFDTYEFTLNMGKAAGAVRNAPLSEEEMTTAELYRYIRTAPRGNERYNEVLIEFHERFSVPFACFALGLLAVPLGLQPMRGKRGVGLVLGLLFFTLYYLMLIVGWAFGESGVYPPAAAMWMPNLIMGGIGWVLLMRTAKERPVRIDSIIIAARDLAGRWTRLAWNRGRRRPL